MPKTACSKMRLIKLHAHATLGLSSVHDFNHLWQLLQLEVPQVRLDVVLSAKLNSGPHIVASAVVRALYSEPSKSDVKRIQLQGLLRDTDNHQETSAGPDDGGSVVIGLL